MGKSLMPSAIIGSPRTSSPVYQIPSADLPRWRSFGLAGWLFPVAVLTQGAPDKKAFTQGLAGRAGWSSQQAGRKHGSRENTLPTL